PGVTSVVLKPRQALEYVRLIAAKDSSLSTIGIAGPGDPMAEPEKTLETLELIRSEFPEMIFCISSNGLNVADHIERLKELGVSHVTLTINAVDPVILSEIYAWVRYKKKIYRGLDAAELMMQKQFEALEKLKACGMTVKINSVIMPGVNDKHVVEVAKVVKSYGADLMNCIPVIPNSNSFFENVEEPSHEDMSRLKCEIAKYIEPMDHCNRCRADAVGKLGHDNQEMLALLQEVAVGAHKDDRPYVAVATHEGILINCHLGEADTLHICEQYEEGYRVFDLRKTPQTGLGDSRWNTMAETLKDCRAVLVSGVGPKPLEILEKSGVQVMETSGLIEEALDRMYNGQKLVTKKRDVFECGTECGGDGMGCN
ncbi:MAG: radical SAM protein, partial [Fibrobacterales bacterium]